MFNPAQRPDVGLLPQGDARFHYYGFGIRRWTAAPDQIAAVPDEVVYEIFGRELSMGKSMGLMNMLQMCKRLSRARP